MATKDYKRLYVWEGPVRVSHWLNVASIVTLTITGFLIADPPALMSSKEASQQYWFGVVRFIHFAAAYVFVAMLLLRFYWMFVGNRYASWKVFIPFREGWWKEVKHVLKHHIFLLPDKENRIENISIGHNAFAATAYLFFFVVAVVMVLTGMGLYYDMSTWWLPQLFGWVPAWLGGDFAVRAIHHLGMWLIIWFVLGHVYMVLFHDWLEARGEVSSMIGGYKFVRKERVRESDKVFET